MAVSDNMQQAVDEYGSSASPYSSLQDYLMQRPVYDRGSREAPNPYSMNKVTVEGPNTEDLLSTQYQKIMDEQKAADQASATARKGEIDSLRDLLRQDISTAEEAAASERSGLTKTLEDRINELQTGVDAETSALRQQGIDERSALTTEQKRISDLIQQNIDQTASDLAASEERVRAAQTEAIGSLEDRQGSLIGDIDARISELGATLNSTQEQINADLDERDAQLTGAQKSAAEAVQSEIDFVRESLGTIQSEIQTENKAQLEALRNERSTLLGNIEASVTNLQENIASLPVDELQTEINRLKTESESLKSTGSDERKQLFEKMEALRDGMLTNDQVNASIAEAMESGTLTPDQINTAIESLKSDVEGKIGGLASTQSLDQLQTDVASVSASTADLGSEIELLQKAMEGSASSEELAALQESLKGTTTQIADLQGQMLDPSQIAEQRQEAITGAINPIQEQIAALQGQIPGEVDVDALRQSIIDELKTQTPPPGGGTGGTGGTGDTGGGTAPVDPGPIVVEPGPGFSGTPYENFMGGFIPGAGQSYDAGVNYGPSASEAAGFSPGSGSAGTTFPEGERSIYGQGLDLTQYAPGSSSGVKNVPKMPGGSPGSGYVKTGAPIAYNQGPFQVQKFDNDLLNRKSFGM
jgi:hypothetical protein